MSASGPPLRSGDSIESLPAAAPDGYSSRMPLDLRISSSLPVDDLECDRCGQAVRPELATTHVEGNEASVPVVLCRDCECGAD